MSSVSERVLTGVLDEEDIICFFLLLRFEALDVEYVLARMHREGFPFLICNNLLSICNCGRGGVWVLKSLICLSGLDIMTKTDPSDVGLRVGDTKMPRCVLK